MKVLLVLSIAMLVSMLLFDSYLTRLPIVMYNNVSILSIKLGSIPIEDFGYLVAVVILVPALFEKFDNEK
jgi:lycopene cyclase domain-containing protein